MSEIKTTDYDGVTLSNYQGKYSIESLRSKDDKFFPVWAKYQKGRDEFQEKSWPVKVVLGDKESAILTLRTMLAELEDDVPLGDTPF